ncbi:sigma-70 family RNA polymerase sigma factor [Planctomycetes bacterium K23_9]|uniref:RNA polymerase sigma factor n=1 Tax=Stieleria marina TaxID=1930275 RepID=A0A517NXJ4_9BACT|nr:RNA polymerase sigma factor [Planctomycetes bacterium K23_9]
MAWHLPETRPSILLRLRDPTDDEAWTVFESIYRSVVVRTAKRRGLQHADAEDVAQVVMTNLSRKEWEFAPDSSNARFRTWLVRVVENAIVDHLRRNQRHQHATLIEDERYVESMDQELESEYRCEVFHWAADIVKKEFSMSAWNVFWATTVENRSIADVAGELDQSTGAIYSCRSRIMRRLKQQVCQFDNLMEDK